MMCRPLACCWLQLLRYAPCEHNVCHAKAAKIPTHRLFHPRYTIARWKTQYDLGGEFTVPSEAERHSLRRSSLALKPVPDVAFKHLFSELRQGRGGADGGGGGMTPRRGGMTPGPKRKKRFRSAFEGKGGTAKRNRKDPASRKRKSKK